MSMWTSASDELTNYLAQQEVERQRQLAQASLLEERRRRGVREDQSAAREKVRFEQEQEDRTRERAEADEQKKKAATVSNLAAQRQASLNASGQTVELPTDLQALGGGDATITTGDPMGAQATRNAIAVALRLAGAGDVADKGAAEDKSLATAAGRQAAITEYQRNPTKQGALALKMNYNIDIPKTPGLTEVSPGATLYNEETGEAKFTAPPLPQRGGSGGGGDDDGEVELSGPALDMAALNYIRGGGIQAGYGKAGNRNRILIQNRAAELGPDANIAANKVEMAANRVSLTKAQAMADAIHSFEGTVKQNIKVFENAAKNIVDTGSPLINKPLRYLQREVLGSTDQAAFDTAHAVIVPELARILTNPNLTGILTDSARKEIDQMLAGNATIPQMAAMLKTLEADMANRGREVDRTIGEIQTRGRAIGTPGTVPGTTPAPPPGGSNPPPAAPGAKPDPNADRRKRWGY